MWWALSDETLRSVLHAVAAGFEPNEVYQRMLSESVEEPYQEFRKMMDERE